METPNKRINNRNKTPSAFVSPRLRPPKPQTPKSVIKQIKNSAVEVSKDKMQGQVTAEAIKKGVTYLDLNNTRFNPEFLKLINEKCCHLNLNNIDLSNATLPNLSELRTLSLENCNIKTLENFPQLNNLRYLSLANNKLTDLKGAKMLKHLERLDMRNNPTEFPANLAMAAFGTFFLEEFNGQEISEETIKEAFSLSPLVGYSLRIGRQLDAGEERQEDFTLDYLTKDLQAFMNACEVKAFKKLSIKSKNDNFYISCPYKSDSIKWFMHVDNEKNEWSEIPNETKETLQLTMLLRMRLIKCVFTIDSNTFSLYTEQPLGRGKSNLCLPYPLSPQIDAIPKEDSVISLLPLDLPARLCWMSNEDAVATDVSTLKIDASMVNTELTCLIKPYTPRYPSLSFETLFTVTEKVIPLKPSVSGIEFPEMIVEFEEINFSYVFSPNHEGQSQVSIEKAHYQYEKWTKIEDLEVGNLKYVPTTDVIGYYLRIAYTPVTDKGVTGETQYFYSNSRVLPSMPVFIDPFIAGAPETYHPIVACATYVGGKKGNCTYTWYTSDESSEPNARTIRKANKVGEGQVYTPNDQDIDKYLYCEMVPVRDDECNGEAVYAVTKSTVNITDPPKPVQIKDPIYTKSKIKFEDTFCFYVSDINEEDGFLQVKEGTSYRPEKEYIGRILRVNNAECDGILGEILPPLPSISDAVIDSIAGGIARLNCVMKNIQMDKLRIVWFRCQGGIKKAVGIDTVDYVLTTEDVTCTLMASLTYFDDHQKPIIRIVTDETQTIRKKDLLIPEIVGSMIEGTDVSIDSPLPVESVIWYRKKAIGPMVEVSRELSYKLTAEDVYCMIEANVTITHQNAGELKGVERQTVICISNETVKMFFPAIHIAMPKTIIEGDLVRPIVEAKKYPQYNKFFFEWVRRTRDGKNIALSNEKDYTVTFDDIGCILQFSAAIYGSDGIEKGPVTTLEVGPVVAHEPRVTKVKISQGQNGKLEVKGDYFGGSEKGSIYEWFTLDENEQKRSLGRTNVPTIDPRPVIFGRQVGCIYYPVRSDGVKGKGVSSNTITVAPLPYIQDATILVKGGKLVSGALLRCRPILKNATSATYQWKESSDQKEWFDIEGANEIEFLPPLELVGKYLMCTIVAINKDGWTSTPYDTQTELTLGDGTGFVIMLANEAKEKEITRDISTVGALLRTNGEGVTWEIYEGDDVVDQVEEEEFLITADHVGQRICANSQTYGVSNMTQEIHFSKTTEALINTTLRAGTFKFTAETSVGTSVWNCTFSQQGIVFQSKKGSVKEGKWKTLKLNCVEQSPDLFEIWLDSSSKFVLKPTVYGDKRITKIIPQNEARNYIVGCIRALFNRYT